MAWALAAVAAVALQIGLLVPLLADNLAGFIPPEGERALGEARRGQVSGQEPRGNAIAIDANVPLANMFGYINTLRSMSSGRAQFTMQFSHYDPVPSNISEEIQAKYA